MLEVYTINQTLTSGSAIPFNNVQIEKGKTAVLTAPSTISLNAAGVYMVAVDGEMIGTEAGDGTVQLSRGGLSIAAAASTATLAAGSTVPYAFTTLVQVPKNNSPCCCASSPVNLQCVYTGPAATGNINVCVTKIC